jgi:hypothetical protein
MFFGAGPRLTSGLKLKLNDDLQPGMGIFVPFAYIIYVLAHSSSRPSHY